MNPENRDLSKKLEKVKADRTIMFRMITEFLSESKGCSADQEELEWKKDQHLINQIEVLIKKRVSGKTREKKLI